MILDILIEILDISVNFSCSNIVDNNNILTVCEILKSIYKLLRIIWLWQLVLKLHTHYNFYLFI